jgi:hypothetical protein
MPDAIAPHELRAGGRCWPWCGAVAAALLFLAGCAGFVYQRLDWLAVWYVNGMVSLEEAQERQLRDIVRSGLDWHRSTQLPLYQEFLSQLDRDTDGPMSVALVEQRYEDMVSLWDPLVSRLVADSAPLLASFTAGQRTELFESIAEDNEEIWDEYAGSTPEARRKRRSKTTIRVLQRFMGHLDAEQRALVNARLDGLHDVAEEWLMRRRAWQAQFRAVLEGDTAEPAFSAALRDLALRPDQFDSAEYRRKVEENRQIVFGMLAELTSLMTGAQRERMGRKLREYSADLEAIMRRD